MFKQLTNFKERSHVMDGRNGGKSSSLGLSDDYEDRVKMIITSELAKEGDKKMSPVKDAKMMQVNVFFTESKNNF